MKSLDLNRYTFSVCVTAAMLASCGGSQPPIAARGEMPQGLAIATQAAHDGSWMPTDGVKFKTLRSFLGPPTDGNNPLASLIEVGGTLFGTTQQGGESYYGTVFKIRRFGRREPASGSRARQGAFYGTTPIGGTGGGCERGCGTIYKISSSGKKLVLYSFGFNQGAGPYADLLAIGRTLYGTAWYGGTGPGSTGDGAVFALSL